MDDNFANILLVEDNPGDALLVEEALNNNKIMANLFIVEDGVEAMAYLKREGNYSDAVRPDLILLDLNLPRKNGREVLEEIKSTDGLKRIPVVILTTSSDEVDILRTYDLHANAYVTKPVDLSQFIKIIHELKDFWFTIVRLPSKE